MSVRSGHTTSVRSGEFSFGKVVLGVPGRTSRLVFFFSRDIFFGARDNFGKNARDIKKVP